jgi:hypothetical protein
VEKVVDAGRDIQSNAVVAFLEPVQQAAALTLRRRAAVGGHQGSNSRVFADDGEGDDGRDALDLPQHHAEQLRQRKAARFRVSLREVRVVFALADRFPLKVRYGSD